MKYAQLIYNSLISLLEANLPKLDDYSNPLDYVKDLWKIYNEEYFDNKLDVPAFRWMRSTDINKVRTYAHFSYKLKRSSGQIFDETISINKKLIRNEELLRSTLIHEMCHQAVVEIDNDFDDKHGSLWKKWARHCGISDNAVTTEEIPLTHSEEERQMIRKAQNDKFLNDLQEVMKNRERLTNLKNGMIVVYPAKDGDTLVGAFGVIGKVPKTGKYITIYTVRQGKLYSGKQYRDEIYSIKPNEVSLLQAKFPPDLINDIVTYANEKDAIKRWGLLNKLQQRIQEKYFSKASRLISNIYQILG